MSATSEWVAGALNAGRATPQASSDAAGVSQIPLVPIKTGMYGPLTLRRRWRTFLIWALIFGACWSILSSSQSPAWKAFALGMMIPGAGFLYTGGALGVLTGALGLLALPVAIVNWFASGNAALMILIWVGGAALSAWFVGPQPWDAVAQVTPYLTLGIVAFWAVNNRLSLRRMVAKAKEHNKALATTEPLLRELPLPAAGPEMTETELAIWRTTLDKGLQPLNQWKDIPLDVEQWQLDATRYKLYGALEQLIQVSYQHNPAFTGYSRDAQANLIQRNVDRKIWSFWFWENLWGNFDVNPDPMRNDNIMITGLFGRTIGGFETVTGDRRFSENDALVYRWNDNRTFGYSFPRMVESLRRNYARYDYGWYPCEPNLIYSMCNIGGFNTLMHFDRLNGTHHWDAIKERVEKSFEEEFMHPDGRTVCLTFTRLGMQAPTLSSVLGESANIPGLMAMWPDKTERLWQVMKRQFLKTLPDGSQKIEFVGMGWDTWDATNVRIRPMMEALPVTALLFAAVEMGDTQVVDMLSTYVDQKFGPGTSIALKLGRRKAISHDLIVRGMPEAWQRGPRLGEAAYPDVLVARAVSDGKALDLVLRPGAGGKQVRLGFERLVPNSRYLAHGAVTTELTADALGKASAIVDLSGRHELRLVPNA